MRGIKVMLPRARRRTLASIEPWISWPLGLLFLSGAAAANALFGPFRVIEGSGYSDQMTPASYLCFVFLPFGLLVGEELSALAASRTPRAMVAAGALPLLAIVAIARLALRIPISGHALFGSYYLAHHLARRRPRSAARLAVGAALSVQVLHYKLRVWHDPWTLATGTALGLVAFAVSAILGSKYDETSMNVRGAGPR
ncbi:MAG: hypothetical protein U0166_03340 [Acidobacteriota bacterium]